MDNLVAIYHFNVKFSVCFHKVLFEGSVSQNFYLGLSFHFMSKNGQLFSIINFYIQ